MNRNPLSLSQAVATRVSEAPNFSVFSLKRLQEGKEEAKEE
jgi:hypothetical protein